jgi:hypothetical protein
MHAALPSIVLSCTFISDSVASLTSLFLPAPCHTGKSIASSIIHKIRK